MRVATLARPVDMLVLGAGWTSTFLLPLLQQEDITFAATTTDGRDGTIPFKFDPESDDEAPFQLLPAARTVLITFPLKGKGPSARLARLYRSATGAHNMDADAAAALRPARLDGHLDGADVQDASSPYDGSNARAAAEDELMAEAGGAVLNLAGLYGGQRQPRNWVGRVVRSKADLRAKGALHLVHGADVARAVVAVHRAFEPGRRWLVSDLRVYDWWDLVEGWAAETLRAAADAGGAEEGEVARQEELRAWVGELMVEEGVRALPRDTAALGRVLDGREFWNKMGIWPSQGRAR